MTGHLARGRLLAHVVICILAVIALVGCSSDGDTAAYAASATSNTESSTSATDESANESATDESTTDSSSEPSDPDELADGDYSCDAYNSTAGNGPYSLECEKSGDSIVLHFSNGGYITLDIDSQDLDGNTWEIDATNADNSDSWDITVAQ